MQNLAQPRKADAEIVTQSWESLEHLRQFALSRGCTPAQFSYAVEVVGPEPRHIARYLQRHNFLVAQPRANGYWSGGGVTSGT